MQRPYVAVWVENTAGKLVRVLAFWANKAKYFSELSSFWNITDGNENLLASTSRATRDAGTYQLVWDGLDSDRKPVPPGTYRIVVETNQEHGSYAKQAGTILCDSESHEPDAVGDGQLRARHDPVRPETHTRMKHVVRVVGHWGLLLHIYISMAGFTLVLLFAITGITLNHEDFGWGRPVIVRSTISVSADMVDRADQTALAALLQRTLGIRTPLSDYREDPDQLQVTFAAPGRRTVVTINRAQRTGEVETETRGLLGTLDDLHKGFDSGRAWYWIIDITAGSVDAERADGHGHPAVAASPPPERVPRGGTGRRIDCCHLPHLGAALVSLPIHLPAPDSYGNAVLTGDFHRS